MSTCCLHMLVSRALLHLVKCPNLNGSHKATSVTTSNQQAWLEQRHLCDHLLSHTCVRWVLGWERGGSLKGCGAGVEGGRLVWGLEKWHHF